MTVPMANLPPIPEELVFNGEVPAQALFFDTNCALHPAVEQAQQQGLPTLISSIVYAELTARVKNSRRLGVLDKMLIDRGLRVVLFDGSSARCFFDVCRNLQFGTPPLKRQDEDERKCRDRLRFDLIVFAAALRHRAVLVTDNTRDFHHFPYPQYWKTRADLFP